MRPEGNPLDLNNLPDDYSRDGKQVSEDSSPSGSRKKKSGGKDGKDECGKVYECRFCSLKFCKSQALGGHMNRHRQERETETLNRARHLVYSNDNLAAHGASHLGCQGYHPAAGHVGDPTLPFRSVYPPPRLYSGSTSTLLPQPPPPPPPQPPQPYLYTSTSRLVPYASQYSHHQHPINDYYVGHVLSSSTSQYPHPGPESNYTCIGAPVGHGFPPGAGRSSDMAGSGAGGGGRDGTLQHLDPHSINRFQERF